MTLELVNVISDWNGLFEKMHLAPQVKTAAGILRLFLDYLKSRSIHYQTTDPDFSRIEFTELQDTRNIFYKNVAIVNVVENSIPHARKTPFLFTERQRQVLGLKTFENIKLYVVLKVLKRYELIIFKKLQVSVYNFLAINVVLLDI